MSRDQALNFNSELIKVKRMIKQIQELGIKTSKIEMIVTQIEEQAKLEADTITQNYRLNDSLEDMLKEGNYTQCYCKALNNLLTLKTKLSEEYNIYTEIHGSCLAIESHLGNMNEQNLPVVINLMLEILRKLKSSSTLNYEDEKDLVEQVYYLTYQVIKTELIYKVESQVLNKVLEDEIDINYVEKHLEEELLSIDFTKPENQYIMNRLKILKSKGLESSYLDLELLNLLKYTDNPNYIEEKKELILNTYEMIEQENITLTELRKQKQELEKKLQDNKKVQFQNKKNILKYSSFIIGSLSVIAGTIFTINSLVKKSMKFNTYFNITQIYDATKDKTETTENYTKQEEDTLYLKKYFPYEEYNIGRTIKYTREVHTYDVSDLQYETLEEYATIDVNTLDFAPEITEETIYSMEPSDYYQEPRTIIEKVIVDKNKVIPKIHKADYILSAILANLIPVLFESIFAVCLIFGNDALLSLLIEYIKDYKEKRIDIKELVSLLIELEQQISAQTKIKNKLSTDLKTEYYKLPQDISKEKEFAKIRKK